MKKLYLKNGKGKRICRLNLNLLITLFTSLGILFLMGTTGYIEMNENISILRVLFQFLFGILFLGVAIICSKLEEYYS